MRVYTVRHQQRSVIIFDSVVGSLSVSVLIERIQAERINDVQRARHDVQCRHGSGGMCKAARAGSGVWRVQVVAVEAAAQQRCAHMCGWRS